MRQQVQYVDPDDHDERRAVRRDLDPALLGREDDGVLQAYCGPQDVLQAVGNCAGNFGIRGRIVLAYAPKSAHQALADTLCQVAAVGGI